MWFPIDRTPNLEPIDPDIALELYLATKETEAGPATITACRSRLGLFVVRWCEEREIENRNELTGRRVHEYRLWRRTVGELSTPSEKTQMGTVWVSERWLETVDGVERDLHLTVRSPDLTPEEIVGDVVLEGVAPGRSLDT